MVFQNALINIMAYTGHISKKQNPVYNIGFTDVCQLCNDSSYLGLLFIFIYDRLGGRA
jgi:hypothetical protein